MKCSPASREVATSCRPKRPFLVRAFVTPNATATVPPLAETSELTPSSALVGSLTSTGADQRLPLVDHDSLTLVGSTESHVAYILPVIGSAVADGRQHRKPGGPPPRSRVIVPTGAQEAPPSFDRAVTSAGNSAAAAARGRTAGGTILAAPVRACAASGPSSTAAGPKSMNESMIAPLRAIIGCEFCVFACGALTFTGALHVLPWLSDHTTACGEPSGMPKGSVKKGVQN